MDRPTYNMTLELEDGTLRRHGFHLGTDRRVALSFVYNALRNMGARSVALYLGTNREGLYDWRDLPEYEGLEELPESVAEVGSF